MMAAPVSPVFLSGVMRVASRLSAGWVGVSVPPSLFALLCLLCVEDSVRLPLRFTLGACALACVYVYVYVCVCVCVCKCICVFRVCCVCV